MKKIIVTDKRVHVAEELVKKAAEQLVAAAIEFYKKVGKKAFAEFSNPESRFTFRTLYIFVIDKHGVVLAHGQNQKLVGTAVLGLKDSDHRSFIKQIVDAAKEKKSGWLEYKWLNNITGTITPKQTYYKRKGEYIFGCGFTKISK